MNIHHTVKGVIRVENRTRTRIMVKLDWVFDFMDIVAGEDYVFLQGVI